MGGGGGGERRGETCDGVKCSVDAFFLEVGGIIQHVRGICHYD